MEYADICASPFTRASEVEKLLELAVSCGYERDKGTFGKIVGVVYPVENSGEQINKLVEMYMNTVTSLVKESKEESKNKE